MPVALVLSRSRPECWQHFIKELHAIPLARIFDDKGLATLFPPYRVKVRDKERVLKRKPGVKALH